MSWRRREVRASGLDDEVEPNLPIDEIQKTLETQRLADKPRLLQQQSGLSSLRKRKLPPLPESAAARSGALGSGQSSQPARAPTALSFSEPTLEAGAPAPTVAPGPLGVAGGGVGSTPAFDVLSATQHFKPKFDPRTRAVRRGPDGKPLSEEAARAAEEEERRQEAAEDEERRAAREQEDEEDVPDVGLGDADDLWGADYGVMADGGPQQQQQRKQRKRQQHQKQPVRRRKEEECVGALEGDEDGGAAECGGDGAGAGGDGGVARARKRSRRGGASSSGSGRGAGAVEDEAGAGVRKPVALLGARELGPEVPLELTFPCGRTFKVPGAINKFLRPYQRDGIRFLLRCYCARHGGILADDMGLGKTVQAISFCAALLGKTGGDDDALPLMARPQPQQRPRAGDDAGEESGDDEDEEDEGRRQQPWPILVVCPKSLVTNWQQEFCQWGSFQLFTYYGRGKEAAYQAAASGQAEVLLTTYDQLRLSASRLAALPIHAVLFDEAHKLSNTATKTSMAARGLATKLRFGLSGARTVMPNDFKDIWGLMSLLVPGALNDWATFNSHYAMPIKVGSSKTATAFEQALGHERKVELSQLLKKNYLLRRDKSMKGIVEQLPRKVDQIVFCQLRPSQARAYNRIVQSADVQALLRGWEVCDCNGATEARSRCCYEFVPEDRGGVIWPFLHCCDCDDPKCKNHKPEGCEAYYQEQGYNNTVIKCPWCLIFPVVGKLRDVASHLDLLRPSAEEGQHQEYRKRRRFEYECAVAKLALGEEAEELGGLVAGGHSWLQLTDTQHCGKMVVLLSLLAQWHEQNDKGGFVS
ncbi:Putative DNA repair and recombination protein RAD26-like protein [Monoraphidium neglectum]|uniref:Putative DNA repair and recombination protein RAD26-like protein n=1 Tax=Monoraphidium neglectum TaxID=145388 RepID=A0A0D2LMB2_9CHLO|nr:Putative DNA repair and recombination protein RAD26-like protein [Monoraphidium neglectum]KIZ07479.1 Putative DNA repair and recombination protein RAD26-like protein [Monoraphidium neglectum]|eukprot:XP_013906498.1 Putative DNA repair and recombination protein RAD26-like protein [Monoraphidium neglectum]